MKAKILLTVGLAILAGVLIGPSPAVRGCPDLEEYGAVMNALPTTQVTLGDALGHGPTTAPETPISARFQIDDNGQLVLSLCTAQQGLGADAEANSFSVWSGGVQSQDWCPECTYLSEAQELSQAAEQLTLMSISPFSLTDILRKAEQDDQDGIPFSITPTVQGRKAEFLVLIAEENRVVRLHYDLMTGTLFEPKEMPVALSMRSAR